MADRLNSIRLARRAAIKNLLLPSMGAGLGLALEIAFGWRPVETFRHVFEWAITLINSVTHGRNDAQVAAIADRLSGPVIVFGSG